MENIIHIDKYITGIYALNIHHSNKKNEPTGDWHGFVWDKIDILPNNNIEYGGLKNKINTMYIWKNYGIYNDAKHFKEKNILLRENEVYVANYYRAILDMIYSSLKKYNDIINLNCITNDCLDSLEQKIYLFKKLYAAKKYFNEKEYKIIKSWINNELNYENNI